MQEDVRLSLPTAREPEPKPTPSVAVPAPLRAYAAGTLSREDALASLGLRDYADLLVALGDAGLTPPRPTAHEIEEQAAMFEALWPAEGPTP